MDGSFAQDSSPTPKCGEPWAAIPNLAEGIERGGRAEFLRLRSMAQGSCGETRSVLLVALDAGHIDEAPFAGLPACANAASRPSNGNLRAAAPSAA